MKIQRFTIYCALLLCLVMASFASADEKKDSNNIYSNPDPASLCTADNTCGSASSTPCMVNIKRTAYSSSATPSIPGARGNDLFCVKTGTTVTWQSDSKGTGFLVDPGKVFAVQPAWPHHGRQREVGFRRGSETGVPQLPRERHLARGNLRQEQVCTGDANCDWRAINIGRPASRLQTTPSVPAE